MERLWLTLAVLAVCVLAGYGLLVGWRHRAQRQAGLPELPSVPGDFGPELATALTGLYVSTTTAGNWQDRIVARGLGRRANAVAELTADGVLIVSWRLGDVELDSGFRADDPALQAAWIDAASTLIPPARPDGGAPTSNGAPA